MYTDFHRNSDLGRLCKVSLYGDCVRCNVFKRDWWLELRGLWMTWKTWLNGGKTQHIFFGQKQIWGWCLVGVWRVSTDLHRWKLMSQPVNNCVCMHPSIRGLIVTTTFEFQWASPAETVQREPTGHGVWTQWNPVEIVNKLTPHLKCLVHEWNIAVVQPNSSTNTAH